MQALKKESKRESISQFEITSDLLRNLYKFNLTPVTKLVLLELTTHLNENKNGSVVFPSVNYISEVLGIGLTAAKKAIGDLINEGLIIKTKRDKIRGNYNKYLLTLKVRKMTSEPSENELFKQSDSDLFMIRTNKQEKINNKGVDINYPEKQDSLKSGGNVYSGDDEILADYAIKHVARNVKAYVNTLKSTGSAAKIIKDYKKAKNARNHALIEYKKTEEMIKRLEQEAKTAVSYETCTAWVEFGEKIKALKIHGKVRS